MSGKRLLAAAAAVFFALCGPQSVLSEELAAQTLGSGTHLIDAHTLQSVSQLTVSEGATAVIDVGSLGAIVLPGNFTNSGLVYFGSSDASATAVNFAAANIFNHQGGVLSTIVPTGLAGFVSAANNLNFNLTAVNDIINAGTISSAGSLSLVAGGSVVNQSVLSAAQNVNLASALGNIANSGTITAALGNINIQSMMAQSVAAQAAQALNVNNAGGVMSALNGAINIRDALFSGDAHTAIMGGDWLSRELNIHGGRGVVDLNAGALTGTLNLSAQASHVNVATANLTIGQAKLDGDPTFINSIGSILINDLVTAGESLAILANGSITAAGSTARIELNSSTSTPFNLLMIAGAQITPNGNTDSSTLPSGGTPTTTDVQVDFSQGNGGDIILAGSTFSGTKINTRGASTTDGAGGSVVLAARASGATGGQIVLPVDAIDTSGDGVGANGDVTLIAGRANNIGIDLAGTITTAGGTGGGGSVTLISAQPTGSGGAVITVQPDGTIANGESVIATSSYLPNDIITRSITTNGAPIEIVTGGGIDTSSQGLSTTRNDSTAGGNGGNMTLIALGGDIATGTLHTVGDPTIGGAGGNLLVAASGNVSATFINTRSNEGGTGGNVNIVAGGDISVTDGIIATGRVGGAGNVLVVAGVSSTYDGNSVTIVNQSASGGKIDLSVSTFGIHTESLACCAAESAGNVSLVAFEGSTGSTASGTISVANEVNTGSQNDGQAGNILMVAGDDDSPESISVSALLSTTYFGFGLGGSVTMGTTTPLVNGGAGFPVSVDQSSGVVSGAFAVDPASTKAASIGVTGSIFTGDGAVGMRAGSEISIMDVTTRGGPVSLIAAGNISTNGQAINASRISGTGPGGDISAVSTTGDITLGQLLSTGMSAPNGATFLVALAGSLSFASLTGGATTLASALDLIISGNIITTGSPINLVSKADVVAGGDGIIIDSSNSSGNAGPIQIVAGSEFTSDGASLTLTGSTGAGGSIRFDVSPSLTVAEIDAQALTPDDAGADITLVAYKGSVLLPSNSSVCTCGAGAGNNGNLTVAAGQLAGVSISVGFVDTAMGGGAGGDVTLATAQPDFSVGSDMTIGVDGIVTSGNSIVPSGDIKVASIAVNSNMDIAGVLNITAGNSLIVDSATVSVYNANPINLTTQNLDLRASTSNPAITGVGDSYFYLTSLELAPQLTIIGPTSAMATISTGAGGSLVVQPAGSDSLLFAQSGAGGTTIEFNGPDVSFQGQNITVNTGVTVSAQQLISFFVGEDGTFTSNGLVTTPAAGCGCSGSISVVGQNVLHLAGVGQYDTDTQGGLSIFADTRLELASGTSHTLISAGGVQITTPRIVGPAGGSATFKTNDPLGLISVQEAEGGSVTFASAGGSTQVNFDGSELDITVGTGFDLTIDSSVTVAATGFVLLGVFPLDDAESTVRINGILSTTNNPGEVTIGLQSLGEHTLLTGTGQVNTPSGASVGILTLGDLRVDNGANLTFNTDSLQLDVPVLVGTDNGTGTLTVPGGQIMMDSCGCSGLQFSPQTPGVNATVNLNASSLLMDSEQITVDSGMTVSTTGQLIATLRADGTLTNNGVLRSTSALTMMIQSEPSTHLVLTGSGAFVQDNATPAFTAFLSDTGIQVLAGTNLAIRSTSGATVAPVYMDATVFTADAGTISTDGGSFSIAPVGGTGNFFLIGTGPLSLNGGQVYIQATEFTLDVPSHLQSNNQIAFVVNDGGKFTNMGSVKSTLAGTNTYVFGFGSFTVAGTGQFDPGTGNNVSIMAPDTKRITFDGGAHQTLTSGALLFVSATEIEFRNNSALAATNNATISLSSPAGSDLNIILPNNGNATISTNMGPIYVTPVTAGKSVFFQNSAVVSGIDATLTLNPGGRAFGIAIGTTAPGLTNIPPNVHLNPVGIDIFFFGTVTHSPYVMNFGDSDGASDQSDDDYQPVSYVSAPSLPPVSAGAELAEPALVGEVSFDQETLRGLQRLGVSIRQGASDAEAYLSRGAVLISGEATRTVSSKFGSVSVGAGALALVIAGDAHLTVYDLHDGRHGDVEVSAGGHKIVLFPSEQVIVTDDPTAGFDELNPRKLVATRNVREHALKYGLRLFRGEFSLPAALRHLSVLTAVRHAPDAASRKTADRLIKMAAIQMHMAIKGQPFKTSR